ncbi:hypothetical protein AB0C90_39110 [Streptomyces sp. NPDC048550]|uniref:hypothetical protein n=1 Tax=Streptomyces sp. NPDC048550 TaxID=3155739 RepID=UPI00342B8B75
MSAPGGHRFGCGAQRRSSLSVLAGAVAAVAGLQCGCGAPAARVEGARQAGQAFEQALARSNYPQACALLAPQTRQQLEEEQHTPCGVALQVPWLRERAK